jgi:hypothetical protein
MVSSCQPARCDVSTRARQVPSGVNLTPPRAQSTKAEPPGSVRALGARGLVGAAVARMAGRVSVALAAGRLVSRRGSPALTTVLVAGSAAAREAASALCPPWARAAAGLRGRDFCSAGAGDSNGAPRCAACGTALSANWTQGLLSAAVRPSRDVARRALASRRRAAVRRSARKPRAALGHLIFVALR